MTDLADIIFRATKKPRDIDKKDKRYKKILWSMFLNRGEEQLTMLVKLCQHLNNQ